ncbi:UNVERIFIED_CONTAM: sodium transport system permease protein [Acetivibrio alkalicellulosi]
MNIKHIWIVLKKEAKDIIRDRKTIITSIVVPMLLIPLLNILVGGSISRLNYDMTENVTVALSKESNTEEIRELVENQIFNEFSNITLLDVDDHIEAIEKSTVRVVMDFDKDYKVKLEEGKPFVISLMYDRSQTKSQGSLHIVWDAIESFNKKIVAQRIEALGLNLNLLQPVQVEEYNVADDEKTSGSMLSMFLPLLIVILLSAGGIAPAVDLVAGEKERNTLEPLLTTKIGRSSLLVGKYLTVTLFSLITVIATMTGVLVGFFINPGSLTMGADATITGFTVPPAALLMAIVISITLGMTFAGIQIALSTYAKSFKEAQTYLSFLMMAAMIPGYATMFMQANEIPQYMFVLPVLNALSAFKEILTFNINNTNLVLALCSSLVYVIIALYLAASMFKKERILFRT